MGTHIFSNKSVVRNNMLEFVNLSTGEEYCDTFLHHRSRRKFNGRIWSSPRWRSRLSLCLLLLYKSISWVPPSAYSYKFVGTLFCAQIDSRKARNRELATFDESRRAVGTRNPMRDKNKRHVLLYRGGERTTPENSLSRSWKVKVNPKYIPRSIYNIYLVYINGWILIIFTFKMVPGTSLDYYIMHTNDNNINI